MSKMNAPKMEVVRFNEADVIVASGIPNMTFSGFGNKQTDDNNVTINGTQYNVATSRSDIYTALGVGVDSNTRIQSPVNAGTFTTLNGLFNRVTSDDNTTAEWDGTWVYDSGAHWTGGGKSGSGAFRKQ